MEDIIDPGLSLHVTWAADGSRGGGSIAAQRTVHALERAGLKARIAAFSGLGAGEVALPQPGLLDRALRRVLSPLGIHDLHRLSSLRVLRDPVWQEARIIHLHIIHSGVFSYALLPAVCRNKKVVLTLHDMWPITGNCIYSYDCNRWRSGCGRCPYPDRYPAMRRDASRFGWRMKRRAWRGLNLAVVAPSRWLADLARESMLGEAVVHHIPYPIDTAVFRPRDRRAARARWGIPEERFVLLFSAHHLADVRKGGDMVPKAVAALPLELRNRLTLLTFGESSLDLPAGFDVPVVNLGFLAADDDRAQAFSAADLFVFPSRADNLPLVIQESLSCGTPVVASNVGGIPDLVRPGVTGDLFAPDDLSALRAALLSWSGGRERLRAAAAHCRQVAETEYAYGVIAQKLRQVYASFRAVDVR